MELSGALRVVVNAISLMAVLVIVYGAVEMFVTCLRAPFAGADSAVTLRAGYARFARWLIGGLTFLLASDIIETVLTPNWEEVARLAATAAIRTFLNYFLERDVMELLGGSQAREGGVSSDAGVSRVG